MDDRAAHVCGCDPLEQAADDPPGAFPQLVNLGEELLLKAGTIVDAANIGAPSATKNATHTRDSEMRQRKKGNPWFFGTKLHVGIDRRGVIHSITTTDAATADIARLLRLLHGQETTRHGETVYYKAEDQLQWEPSGGRYLVNKSGQRTAYWDAINGTRSRIRANIDASANNGRCRPMPTPARDVSSDPRARHGPSQLTRTSMFSTAPAILA